MKISPLDPWVRQKIGSDQKVTTRQDIEAWQLRKLNETLNLVRTKSAFYRQHFKGLPETLGHLDELSQFPFTTPEDVRRNPLQFICVSQNEIHRVVTLQSSGTTGAPKRIYFTAADQELTIDFFGVGMSSLTEPEDKVMILLPAETPGSVGDLLRIGLSRTGRKPIPHGPVRDPQHSLETMNEEQADCLVGSPTQVLGLARRWQPGQYKPRSVLLSTDYLPAAIVKVLENTWGCQVYNHYGATEMGLGGGVECCAHRGYHLREADLYFEVIDPLTGQPILDPNENSQQGEVVFSTLTRTGMPLVRYRMDDRSRFIPGPCPCGTSLKTLEIASGRFGGFLKLGDTTLRMPDFDEVLFTVPGLLNFSLSLTGPDEDEVLHIDAQMLTSEDAAGKIKQTLTALPGLENIKQTIRCHHNPAEPGSLLKRIILDQRG